ncbi:MAG: hypothetical protein ACT4OQ_05440 [Chloroflexota bacterium]
MKTGILAVIALGAVVWGFAVIGIFSVAQAIGPSVPPGPAPLLAPIDWDLERAQIVNLPEYPGAVRSEFRQEVFGDELVTEIEYVVESGTQQVIGHYRETFDRGGWTVTGSTWVRGEWTYAVSRGTRHGVVEIERRDGVTEVEVEMAEPTVSRGHLTDR